MEENGLKPVFMDADLRQHDGQGVLRFSIVRSDSKAH
jgi:hypothetical protein